VGLRARLDIVEKRKFFSLPGIEPYMIQFIAQSVP
jgi:hypothetical protein